MEKLDLNEIYQTWLMPCGSCDAGLATNCTCPQGDPRSVIMKLVLHLHELYGNYDMLACSTMGEAVDHMTEAEDLLDTAWGVIANSPGWSPGNPIWVRAAEQWRDNWHRHLGKIRNPGLDNQMS